MKDMFNIYNRFFPRKILRRYISSLGILCIIASVALFFLEDYIKLLFTLTILAFEYTYSCSKLSGILVHGATQNNYIRLSPNGFKPIKKAIYADSVIRFFVVFISITLYSLTLTFQFKIIEIIGLTVILVGIGELATFTSYFIVQRAKLFSVHIVNIALLLLILFFYMTFQGSNNMLFIIFTIIGAVAIILKQMAFHKKANTIYK